MQRSAAPLLLRTLRSRGFSSSSSDKIVAAVLFERLPVVIPKIHPVVYAFQEFSFRWRQQYRRRYPDEVLGRGDARAIYCRPDLKLTSTSSWNMLSFVWHWTCSKIIFMLPHPPAKASASWEGNVHDPAKKVVKGKGDYKIDYEPAPRITEADKTNDRRSLQRALDRRLYLLLKGSTYGAPDKKPVWHFPEKLYENEETLRLCAESALRSVLGGLHHTYFVGNAPMAHTAVEPKEDSSDTLSFKRFFFKSQVIGTSKLHIGKCEDYVWVTKDELMEYFPEQADFFNKMIIS